MRKWIVLGFVLAAVVAVVVVMFLGCGQQGVQETVVGVSGAITVKGMALSGATSGGIFGFGAKAAGLANETVNVGYNVKNSKEIVSLGTTTTDSNGKWELSISKQAIIDAGLTTTATGSASNIAVVVGSGTSKVGAVIPSVSLDKTETIAPFQNADGYKKQQIFLEASEDGVDPRDFDFYTNIDSKFSSGSMTDIDSSQFAQLGAAVNSADGVEEIMYTSQGVTDTSLIKKMHDKAEELYRTYIQPILQAAYNLGSEPSQATLDATNVIMAELMKAYALSLGIREDVFTTVEYNRDQAMVNQMQEVVGEDNTAMQEMNRRVETEQQTDLFLTQYDAALTLAQASVTGKQSFQEANPAKYAAYLAAKDTIKRQLEAYFNDSSVTDLRVIEQWMRQNCYDIFIFPPPTNMEEGIVREGEGEFNRDAMEAMMRDYISGDNARIMVYFMMTFFDEANRSQIFGRMSQTMMPIFQNHNENQGSAYYMGPAFWDGTLLGHQPTEAEIQSRTAAYKTAIDTAWDQVLPLSTLTTIGFSNAADIRDALLILTAPPDAM